jgi:hypothetical protein
MRVYASTLASTIGLDIGLKSGWKSDRKPLKMAPRMVRVAICRRTAPKQATPCHASLGGPYMAEEEAPVFMFIWSTDTLGVW